MSHSVPWKLQKSSISKGKIFLLSDPGFDLDQMPFSVPNKSSVPLGVIPWHIKSYSEEMLLGLAGPKRKHKKRERGDISKWGQTVLGTFSTEASVIWNLASLGAAGGAYLFLIAISCFKLQKWGVLCRLSLRNCLFLGTAQEAGLLFCFLF